MSLIESYDINEQGYHPFIIRDSWQVAKLNYTDELHISNLDHLKIHQNIETAFALLRGKAVLITINNYDKNPSFSIKLMKRGTSYFIPKKTMYAIVMEESSEMFIVENSNTPDKDPKEYWLNEEQLHLIRSAVKEEFKK